MRLALMTSEPLDVARGSGTAMALQRLRSALALRDVSTPVISPRRHTGSHTVDRWLFNRDLRARDLDRYDAVLGVNGDGWQVAGDLGVPFVVLLKAMYSRAAAYERSATAAVLRLHAHWERQGTRRADCVIAPSHDAAASVIADYGADPARTRVIPEPFDAAAWWDALPAREKSGQRVLCVAHLYPRKQVASLVDAWPLVTQQRPDARLDVVGDGPELRRITQRAQHVPSVFLHGHIGHPHILELYARADAFCLPSAQETFGYAAVEAMASGLPLVLAADGALAEITAGAVAEHVMVDDASALAAAIVRSLDPAVRARAATESPQRARSFTPESVADAMVETVNELHRNKR